MSGSLDVQSEALLFPNGVSSATEVDTSLSPEETGNGTLEVGYWRAFLLVFTCVDLARLSC